MERVVRYVNDKFRNASNSREVQSQKEELIADLHDKIHDAMSRGKTEDEAFDEAVAAMDGMEELTNALGGKRRTIYVNRLNFHHSLLVFAVIALEILAFAAYQFTKYWPAFKSPPLPSPYTGALTFNMPTAVAIFVGLGIALLATVVYPLIVGFICKANPGKAQSVSFDFRKSLTGAVIGWLALSAFLAAVNYLFPTYANSDMNSVVDMFINPYPSYPVNFVCWFIWPLIGISNWPLSMLFYGLLFRRRRYTAG